LTEICQVQTPLCVQVLHSAILAAQHSSGGRQPNFAAWYKEWNYGTFTGLGGDHVGHQPTF